MPRWAAKAKARSESRLGKRGAVPMQTPEVKTPEALLREKGGGGTPMYLVKWHGFASPTWELASKIETMKAFPALLAQLRAVEKEGGQRAA